MYLIIPLSIFLGCLLGIAYIINRKRSHLNDFVGSLDNGQLPVRDFSWKSYGEEFFPEFKIWLNSEQLNDFKTKWLNEAEKAVRKMRLFFLKIDRLSDALISKIRRTNANKRLNGSIEAERQGSESVIQESVFPIKSEKSISPIFLKNEEERLILEIAKTPKNYDLYRQLGDLYMEMDNFSDAKESYEAAIELNSQDESLKQKLSSVLKRLTQN